MADIEFENVTALAKANVYFDGWGLEAFHPASTRCIVF